MGGPNYVYLQRVSKNSLSTISTINEVFLKEIFSEFEDISSNTPDAFTFPEEILKRNTLFFWVLAVSK